MSFLKKILNGATVAPQQKVTNSGPKKERNPVRADIRVFATGAVYPSAVAARVFGLEYAGKGAPNPGNGFDVIDGRLWNNLKADAIFVSPVNRDNSKVDLFASCGWNADGTPMTSVMTQGATTYGKTLLAMIKEVYGVTTSEEKDYIDLVIEEDPEFQATLDSTLKGVFHFPKTFNRGTKKGETTYQRRENAKVYGLVPVELVSGVEAPETEDTKASVDAVLA